MIWSWGVFFFVYNLRVASITRPSSFPFFFLLKTNDDGDEPTGCIAPSCLSLEHYVPAVARYPLKPGRPNFVLSFFFLDQRR